MLRCSHPGSTGTTLTLEHLEADTEQGDDGGHQDALAGGEPFPDERLLRGVQAVGLHLCFHGEALGDWEPKGTQNYQRWTLTPPVQPHKGCTKPPGVHIAEMGDSIPTPSPDGAPGLAGDMGQWGSVGVDEDFPCTPTCRHRGAALCSHLLCTSLTLLFRAVRRRLRHAQLRDVQLLLRDTTPGPHLL